MIVTRHFGGGAIINNANPRMKALLLRTGAFQKFVQGREECSEILPLGCKYFLINEKMDKIMEVIDQFMKKEDKKASWIVCIFLKLLITCKELDKYKAEIQGRLDIIDENGDNKKTLDDLYNTYVLDVDSFKEMSLVLTSIPMKEYSDKVCEFAKMCAGVVLLDEKFWSGFSYIYQIRDLFTDITYMECIVGYIIFTQNNLKTIVVGVQYLPDEIRALVHWHNVYCDLKNADELKWTVNQKELLCENLKIAGKQKDDIFKPIENDLNIYDNKEYIKLIFETDNPRYDQLAFKLLTCGVNAGQKENIIKTCFDDVLSYDRSIKINEIHNWLEKKNNDVQNEFAKPYDDKIRAKWGNIFGQTMSFEDKLKLAEQMSLFYFGTHPKNDELYTFQGNKFKIDKIPGDGNCFYTSLANQFLDPQLYGQQYVRDKIATYVKKHWDQCNPIFDLGSQEKYLEGVKGHAWGGYIEAYIFSKIYPTICLTLYDFEKRFDPLKINEGNGLKINLLFSGKHYDILLDKEDDEDYGSDGYSSEFESAGEEFAGDGDGL
jgi:hypothetical protein